MDNMSQFYPMIADTALTIVRTVITIVFAVIILPWIKNTAIPWMKEKRIYGVICRFVRAAEKVADSGFIEKKAKLGYVIELLEKRGICVTPDVRALIESAVGDLDDEIAHNIQNLVTVLESAADEAGMEIVVNAGKPQIVEDAAEEVEYDTETFDDEEEENTDGLTADMIH